MVPPAWFLRLVKDSSASIVVATRGMASFTPNAKAWKPPKARFYPKQTGEIDEAKPGFLPSQRVILHRNMIMLQSLIMISPSRRHCFQSIKYTDHGDIN